MIKLFHRQPPPHDVHWQHHYQATEPFQPTPEMVRRYYQRHPYGAHGPTVHVRKPLPWTLQLFIIPIIICAIPLTGFVLLYVVELCSIVVSAILGLCGWCR